MLEFEQKLLTPRGFPSEKSETLIKTVYCLFGCQLSSDSEGVKEALRLAIERHNALVPPYEENTLITHISADVNGTISFLITKLSEFLSQKNYPESLMIGNWIYAYGELDWRDRLGGSALNTSLNLHRAMIDAIMSEESIRSGDDFALWVHEYDNEILPFRKASDNTVDSRTKEIRASRAIIHVVASLGGLGQEAKQYVDPFAMVIPDYYIPRLQLEVI